MEGIVAIVGRPNVGKSTLFNRLIEQRQAIVEDMPGVTRDRNTGNATWGGRLFTVIDTGGYVPESADVFEAAIREQVEIALQEANVVVFIVDVKDGLTPADEDILDVIRRRKKTDAKVVLGVNKVDNYARELRSAEFYALGLAEAFPISAMTGAGTGDLLDEVVRLLPTDAEPVMEEGVPKIAIVGRPNVGKSSLINALLGKQQHIVTPIAGTTRDSIATRYKAFGFDFYLIDTAGMRRKARVNDNVEFYSVIRTLRAIQEADIVMLMVDANSGIEAQDLAILHQIDKQRKPLIILANKWDTVPKTPTADRDLRTHIEARIAPLSNIPILFISALEKVRLHKALEKAKEIYDMRNRIVPTRELNEVLIPIIEQTPPPSQRGKLIRIKFITQVEGRVPTFLMFCNHPKLVKENYKRFLETKIRENFGFEAWPLNIFFREK